MPLAIDEVTKANLKSAQICHKKNHAVVIKRQRLNNWYEHIQQEDAPESFEEAVGELSVGKGSILSSILGAF